MTINRSQQMLINAICLYHAPEVVKFAAIFSDMTELLEECMGNFVQAVSNGQADIQPGTFFNDELADLAGDFIDQVQDQADDIIADYGHLLDEMAATGGLAQAQECVDQIKTTLPGLVPLDQPAAAKDLLAYLGFMDKENPYSRLLFNFLDCFKPVFSFIEEEQRREREEEQQQQHNWFAAAEKNDTAALLPLLEDVDITLTNNDSLTALAVAASLDHAETVRLLLEHGATPHDSFSSHSPAVLAVRNNSTRALQSMLDSNHSELQKVNWKSLLEDICQDDRLAVFSLILAHIDDEFDLSELAARAIRNHAGLILQHLLKQGLAASATRFSTPLSFIALEESNTTALELLLDNGTDINQPDWHDRILLEKAINDDKQAFVTLLLSRGANLDATRLINLPEILEKLSVITGDRIADLIDKGIIKTARIPLLFFIIGKTSIDAAEREIVTHLLDRCDIDINLMEEDGDDNLITTCYDETLFNLLLERKPDLNVSFSDSNTLAEKLLDRFE
ncbi:MAG: ankyrin repeat domain-containing protein, partial [Gammaproteobacteria bacterium]|nr:ankyrin repeat domain-containing protein [Gammaproteobacteria bacterium]